MRHTIGFQKHEKKTAGRQVLHNSGNESESGDENNVMPHLDDANAELDSDEEEVDDEDEMPSPVSLRPSSSSSSGAAGATPVASISA